MSIIPPAAHILEQGAIPFRLFQHLIEINSLEQAATERGQSIDQVVRSILFRLSEGKFIMVLITGKDQVSWTKLRNFIGQSRLTLATREEVMAITGYQVGSVSPLGVPGSLRILADKKVFHNTFISIGSGIRGIAIIMESKDLRLAVPTIEIVSLSSEY